MGLDFWAVKIKKDITENNFKFDDCWDLIENVKFSEYMDEDLKKFIYDKNDKVWKRFCDDTVGYFVNGDPIHLNSLKDINLLADKLNEFIKKYPDFEYKYDKHDTYSNEDVKKFIRYINLVKNKGFVLWCSY